MIIISAIIVVKFPAPLRGAPIFCFCSLVFQFQVRCLSLWFWLGLEVVLEQLRLIESFLCHIFDS